MAAVSSITWQTLEEVAEQAEVDLEVVERLRSLGAIGRGGAEGFTETDVRRVRLLHAWEEAGLPAEHVMGLVRDGDLSIAWLDTPVMTRAGRGDRTVADVCAEVGVRAESMQALYEAMGFAPPDPADLAREGDRELVDLINRFVEAGAEEAPTLRLIRIYADSVRRIAKAEAELYETQIEEPLRRSGRDERELLEFGARFGDQVVSSLERAILDVYRRHRQHVWIEHSINHAETALERAGLFEKVPRPPSICFVDLTGYTHLTEIRGDEFAARLASNLASLVEDISRRRGGRPIRWLGDGGMFHFKESSSAVLAGLDMVEAAPAADLPPMHIGVHTGPVIFQDGDVYGRTVNLASRIASYATAGQVLASEETVRRADGDEVTFEPLGDAELKGLDRPVRLYRAGR
ncbi:MAG TPA: adenylate/guanylate cyclase domain-containing protein [Actinomycetota bacterium]|nr:adenylate/guanylate cyclase domain-containing protein [Actinomycetota bacterium]